MVTVMILEANGNDRKPMGMIGSHGKFKAYLCMYTGN